MTTRAKLTLYSALATALAALCLTPLVTPNDWVFAAFFQIAVVAAAGAGLRRLALPRPLVVPLQLVVVCYTLLLTSVGDAMAFGLVPGARALDEVNALLLAGGTDVQQYAIPAPAHAGVQLILVSSVALVAVLVDALAVTYRCLLYTCTRWAPACPAAARRGSGSSSPRRASCCCSSPRGRTGSPAGGGSSTARVPRAHPTPSRAAATGSAWSPWPAR